MTVRLDESGVVVRITWISASGTPEETIEQIVEEGWAVRDLNP
jgi:hypothetical protein